MPKSCHLFRYLPIFTVTNPNKPGKLRIVWDAAAASNGISLNDMLLKGPDLMENLATILLRFREKQVAICGDIHEMFHQIKIREEDQNSQRFLWRTDPKKPPEVYLMKVMTFNLTCSPFSVQYVKKC